MSYRTAYCAVCASSITSSGSRNRASHSATLGTAIAAALPAHALPIARGSGGSECAHALPRHSPLAPQAPSRPSIRSRNVPPRSSPASADRTASLPTRPVRPPPRAPAAHHACDACLLRPDPCPAPLLQCYDWLASCERRDRCSLAKSPMPPPPPLRHGVCSWHRQCGIARVCAGYKARARATEDARPDVASEMRPASQPPWQCVPQRCPPSVLTGARLAASVACLW